MVPTVYFNPSCSKCRTVVSVLAERGLEAEKVRYLEKAPTREVLEDLLVKLGTDDPRDMMRTGESVYERLGLADADRDALLDAMVANPILIERPIVVYGDKAVIARPPERAFELF